MTSGEANTKGVPSPLAGEGWEGGGTAESRFPHSVVAPLSRGRAKAMRGQPTQAEQRLWRALRAHRLEGFGFRRQVPMGNYIADFVCHRARLVVEVDGATHSTGSEVRRDQMRDAWFASRGYATLRIWNDAIRRDLDGVVGSILAACEGRMAPLPGPPPQGGREMAS